MLSLCAYCYSHSCEVIECSSCLTEYLCGRIVSFIDEHGVNQNGCVVHMHMYVLVDEYLHNEFMQHSPRHVSQGNDKHELSRNIHRKANNVYRKSRVQY